MKNMINFFLILILSGVTLVGQTFDEQLTVVTNDGITNFSVSVDVKGNSLPAATTLNSATIDINYDNSLLTFVDATSWAFGFLQGYSVSATNNGTFIRVLITGTSVGPSQGPGYEVTTSFTPWVQLNFTHSSPSSTTNMDIAPGSNAISLFDNTGNDPNTGANTSYPINSATGLTDQPLPVELTSFSANSVEGVKAQLNWETATEVNNYGFEVERSVVLEDAEMETATWEQVAFVKGHGNSNSNKIYSFTDQNLVGGSKFMYRLKQIDIDGTFEYSDAIEVEVLPSKYELFQNYPNPFNPSTNIKFSLPEDAKIAINIYNILGEKVASVLNQEMKAGYHQVDFNSRSAGYSIASGVYIYTIESKNFSQVKKMILMK